MANVNAVDVRRKNFKFILWMNELAGVYRYFLLKY